MSSTPSPESRETGYVHISSETGHRDSYAVTFEEMFGLARSVGRIDRARFRRLVAAPRLVFATIDDDLAGFVRVSLARALLGRRTAGLFLRPVQCFLPGRLAYRVKYRLFAALRRLPGVSLFTIIPFEFRPEFDRIAAGWVHDPQIWDVGKADSAETPLSAQIRAAAGGRRVMSVLGGINRAKGVRFLADVVEAGGEALSAALCVAVAGKAAEQDRDAVARLTAAGALVEDRYLSDAELLSMFAVSDLVWACYAPDYDQASGIFGRSLQLDRRPVVRSGAIIEQYARLTPIAPLALDSRDPEAAAQALIAAAAEAGPAPGLAAPLLDAWRQDFRTKIAARL